MALTVPQMHEQTPRGVLSYVGILMPQKPSETILQLRKLIARNAHDGPENVLRIIPGEKVILSHSHRALNASAARSGMRLAAPLHPREACL